MFYNFYETHIRYKNYKLLGYVSATIEMRSYRGNISFVLFEKNGHNLLSISR